MSRWLAALPLVALVALAVLFGVYALGRNPQVQPDAMVGRPLPQLALPSLDHGRDVDLGQASAGGPVLINFFASWCAPCQVEHPVLMDLSKQQVRIIGVAYKDAPANAQAFLTRLGDPYAERLVDRDGRAGIEFGITGVPETFLVAADGTILAKHTGPLSGQDAARLIAQAGR